MKRKFLKTWIIYLFNGVIIEKEFYEGFKDVAIVQLLFVFLKNTTMICCLYLRFIKFLISWFVLSFTSLIIYFCKINKKIFFQFFFYVGKSLTEIKFIHLPQYYAPHGHRIIVIKSTKINKNLTIKICLDDGLY